MKVELDNRDANFSPMPLTPLLLTLTAALLHATWNLLAKQASSARHLIFLHTAAGAIIFLPIVLIFYRNDLASLTATQFAFLAASAITHLFYALMLQHSYRHGDLSVVYPIARGTGPLVSTLGGILLFAEQPSPLGLCGAVGIIGGVFFLAGGRAAFAREASGARYGVYTGLLIAAYTLTDARAVSAYGLAPIVIDFTNNIFRAAVLFPRAARELDVVTAELRQYKFQVLGIAVLGPAAYILVLHVLKTTPVSYVAPAREVSMLLAAVLGAFVLGEENLQGRAIAAVFIALGVAALALA
ncbi:MAG: EamA family transporter [Bdellovibrionota bacterium]